MIIIKSYRSGWKKVWKNKKMWVLLYLLNFAFALLSAVPFSGFLSKSIGHSLANLNMLNSFDYTFISELVREYESGLSVIMNLSVGIILLFFIFSIFWMGGILSILKNKENNYSFRQFWQGSTVYFWKLTRLTFYFSCFQIIIFGFFAFLFLRQGISPFEIKSEISIIKSISILLPIYISFAIIIFMIQDYAKIHIVHDNRKLIFQSIKNAFQFVLKNFGKCFGLYLFNLVTFAAFFGIYWSLSNSFKSDSSPTIALLFIIGQSFIFSRIAVKILNLGSAMELYHTES